MDKLPKLGKIHPAFFNKVIYPRLGHPDKSVIVKPQHGVDFGVIDLGGKVLVLSTDPFYIAKELGIEKNVRFTGFLDMPELAKYYRASDIFAIMSTAETQSLALMQAFASGLPAVGASAHGLKEYLKPECSYCAYSRCGRCFNR